MGEGGHLRTTQARAHLDGALMERPSYLTSTFSAVTLVLTVGFVALCLWVKDIANLKEVVMLVLGGYGVKKGIELTRPNGKPKEPPA